VTVFEIKDNTWDYSKMIANRPPARGNLYGVAYPLAGLKLSQKEEDGIAPPIQQHGRVRSGGLPGAARLRGILVGVDGHGPLELAAAVHDLIAPVTDGRADQSVGARVAIDPAKAYRPMHTFGNRLVTAMVNRIFNSKLKDIMSGYRVFTREVEQSESSSRLRSLCWFFVATYMRLGGPMFSMKR
jgi:hypothetical protein